jgi:AraC family transcriptional regulator
MFESITAEILTETMNTPNFAESRKSYNGNESEFTLAESIYPAGLRMPIHDHEPTYLSLLLEGAYTETSNQGERTCKPSTIVFHPPGDRHAVDFHNAEVRIFRVEIKSRWLERTLEYGSAPESSSDFHGGLISTLCWRLYGEFQNGDVCSPLTIEGLMLEITAELLRLQVNKVGKAPPRWLKEARDTVSANISEPPSIDALAQMVGVHPVSLAREFRRHYRCTIGEYVRQIRIETACQELTNSEAPLSMVATNAGFYDQSHFANTFRRYTGMTPKQYRATERFSQRKSRL